MASEKLYGEMEMDTSARPYTENLSIYYPVNGALALCAAYGASHPFFGNLFLGLSVILAIVCLAIIIFDSNVDYAKGHTFGFHTAVPWLMGFMVLGFGWYFCWLLWWGMGFVMLSKKIVGDAEIANQSVDGCGAGPVPSDSTEEPINETYYGRRDERGE